MNRRATVCAALFVLFALGSQAHLLSGLRWQTTPGEDLPSRAEQRLAPLRPQLPARGTVGYRADPSAGEQFPSIERYYAAQYVLCPLIVQHGDQTPRVIDAEDGARVETNEAP